jgi:CHAT domain
MLMRPDDPFIGILPSSSEAIIGFELLPDARLFSKASSASPLSLVDSLWASGIRAFDLRFVRMEPLQGMRVYLLCRIQPPTISDRHILYKYGQGAAKHVQHIFDKSGNKLQLLVQENALNFVRRPFHFQLIAEIRRKEEIQIFSQDYAGVEFYVAYPWEWYCVKEIPYFDSLLQQQGSWLVSIYLEPTHLNALEENLMDRATSSINGDMLLSGGRQGEKIYQTYTAFAQRLERPYLLRINVAASSQQTLAQVSQIFLHQWQNAMPNPVLQYTTHPSEHQAAERNISNLEWLLWGSIRDHEPNSARLRYLTDSKGASMVFHLPTSQAKKLKVLIVFANPKGTSLLHLQQEERLIKEAIRGSRYRDNFESPTILPAATINDLSRALLEDEFHIVHIAAHGNMNGLLVLEDELGNPMPVPQEPLANLFKRYKATIRCVLLNACKGLAQGESISFGIPYTIAMEGDLDDKAALAFSRGFYEALGAGHEIDVAYEEGQSRVSLTAPQSKSVSQLFVSR